MRLAVVILAGGEGRRIGGGKPLRLLAGRTLLDHALALARPWSNDIAIAVRSAEQIGETNLPLLIDREGAGPIAGIASALEFADARGVDAVLTVPTDTPLLPADLPDRLGQALSDEAAAAVPSSAGRLHPASSLWGRAARSHLPAYLATGRGSILGLAERIGYAAVEWRAAPFDPFLNINSEAELATAEELLRSR